MPPPFLLLLLTVATYASVWNGKADAAWHSENETEFTITTAEQLAGFAELVNGGNNFEGKTVKLGANIMLNDTANWQSWASKLSKNEWLPIGKVDKGNIINGSYERDTINSFNGIFDGNGFTVSGVYINSAKEYQGFFGYVGSGGAIKKLIVLASYIKGKRHVGGLVGFNNDNGAISNSYSSGDVIGERIVGSLVGSNYGTITNSHSSGKTTGELNVGGLVGRNGSGIEGRNYSGVMLYTGGTIINSHSTAWVTGKENVGGLVGSNGHGTVSNSYSAGTVTGKKNIGGLVGENPNYATEVKSTIINCYSSSEVTGESFIGGLVGNNNGMVSNSYSSGDVNSSRNSGGGLVGYNKDLIVNSYSVGTLTNKSIAVNGLVGINTDKGTVINGYYMISDRHYDKQAGKPSEFADSAKGKTTAEMQSKAFADSLNFMAGLLSAKVWIHSPGKYPVLSEQIAPMPNMDRFFAGGNGTETNPYIISTKKHLENLAYFVNSGVDFLGKHFKLSQNIKVSKWTPIGGIRLFQGTFDGNGFAVSRIYINNNSGFYAGLFGSLGSNGTIKNLGVTDVNIKTDSHAGGLVNDSKGTIINCYSTGKVAAKYNLVGGLVGFCRDTCRIINSYSTVSVSGQNYIGGLAGVNEGFISGSYSTGKVDGTAFYLTETLRELLSLYPPQANKNAGGLAGSNKGTIINSHSSSKVTGVKSVGGLVGDNEGTVSGSYFTGNVKRNKLVGDGKEAVDSYYGREKK